MRLVLILFNLFFCLPVYSDENSEIIGIEDYDFNLRIINKFGIAKKFSNLPLGEVTDHNNRSVNIDSITKSEKRFSFFKNKLFNSLDYKNVNLRIKCRILSTSSLYVSLICMKNKNKLKSLKYKCKRHQTYIMGIS